MSRVPRIRFKGFEEDWEQRKLGEVADIIGGGTPSTLNSDYWDGNIDWYSPAEIIDQIYVDRSQRKITELGFEKSSAKMLPEGTVLFTSRAGIGKTAILAKKGCTNQGFQSIVPHSNKLDSYFIFSRTEELKKYGELVGAGSTFVEVSGRQMENMQLMIPKTIDEQHIIGVLFSTLDHLITLHQRKLEKLKIIKKSMLENLFPQNGEKTPKIRFSGFTEDWEQRKHGEVFIYLRNNTLSREELNDEDGFAQSIHYGDVLIKYGECLNVSKELLPYIDNKNIVNKFKKFYIQNGDVIIADTAEDETVGKCIEISGIVDHNIISGLHTIPLRPVNKFAYGYLGFYLNSNSYHNQLKPLMQGIKVTSISKNLLKKTTLNYPSNIQEQKIIGRYFDALDHLITLHQLEPFQLIFKAIAYRIIDYTKSKPPSHRK